VATYTPSEFSDSFYGGKVTERTIRNWCRNGRNLGANIKYKRTPTGRYLIEVNEASNDSPVSSILADMKARRRA